jgi:hypothetical protein
MTVTLQSVSPAQVTSDKVRMFLRDYAPNNILLDQVQFTDTEIQEAVDFATDEWNSIVPLTGTSIPKSLLLLGTAAWLSMSESFLQLRNQATYQDGNIASIGVDDKHVPYLQMARALKEEWKTTAREYKKYNNAAGGYGSLHSGYSGIVKIS